MDDPVKAKTRQLGGIPALVGLLTGGGVQGGHQQVWSLSSFKVSRQLSNDLNQVSSVSLLMTSSTALTNEGLFELTRHPSTLFHMFREYCVG